MIVGNPSLLAIESSITDAYVSRGLLGLGFFVIHVGGHRYGVYEPEATMLGGSFAEVKARLTRRGEHTAPFATEPDVGKIADAYINAIFAEEQDESFWGIPLEEFCRWIHSNQLDWASSGNAAFDDGSRVLQFDVNDRVRLVAFIHGEHYLHVPSSLRDVWLPADDFYDCLQKWSDAFWAEWAAAPKSVCTFITEFPAKPL